ncbi:MAG: UDP-N-acetylmuramoyl-tripeptide--D-alanyl-D-alanine ligase [Bacteroidales bacterium]|jgi:UDP-N-acetylmuramoyl-tripeptide--D-alanyl-D-alanine ligase|nr:UDP-N-acetylmuramoyl-tripeptide--D-alanyl-D-alanine ligase [Bacteroidales bacterium]
MLIEELYKIFLGTKGITTDTRNIVQNGMFFALKGENFDGNMYVDKAFEAGAAYAVVDNPESVINSKTILVDNTLLALQQLATHHRKTLGIPVISITGTNGKTTTKELVREVLCKKYNVAATKGNLNNHIGVPLTILSFTNKTEIGIVEMGANHIGEIAELCNIGKPDYGLITNIGTAHIEGFGSYKGVIKAKTEMYQYIGSTNGKAFVNSADNVLMEYADRYSLNKIIYPECMPDSSDGNILLNVKWNEYTLSTNLVGAYNTDNIRAAIAVGTELGVSDDDIRSAIEGYVPNNNRSQMLIKGNKKIVIDAYNANPSSMNVAIDNIEHMNTNNRVLILGDMLELGNVSEIEHNRIVEKTDKSVFTKVYLVGDEFKKCSVKYSDNVKLQFFDTVDQLSDSDRFTLPENCTILIKGSRGIKLEKILDKID